jgi:NAD(P)-dependent dehydrogenase (short-subunit alcohol dehydrogenase family)
MFDLNQKVVIVTGASRGIGRGIAEVLARRGAHIVAAARADNAAATVDAIQGAGGSAETASLDVTDSDSVETLVEAVLTRHGRIDVLVNNAGRTQVGALEETTEDELRYLFELHFFGPAALTRAVLPHMRRQGGGAVIQMSSVGGQVTAPGFSAYCATKFALEGLTETVSQEVDFGVRFLIVEPGAFRTQLFSPGAAYQSKPIPEYTSTVGPTRDAVIGGDGNQPGDPAKAASAILAVLDAPEPPLRLALGDDAVDGILQRLRTVEAEVRQWEPISRGTSFDEAS